MGFPSSSSGSSLLGFWASGSRSHGGAASVFKELLDNRGVSQRGDVAQVTLVTGDFTEHPSHDFPCRVEAQKT